MTRRSTRADVTFVSFDNVAVGRLMAEAMVKARATATGWRSRAIPPIRSSPCSASGQMEVLQPLIDKGQIKIVAQAEHRELET